MSELNLTGQESYHEILIAFKDADSGDSAALDQALQKVKEERSLPVAENDPSIGSEGKEWKALAASLDSLLENKKEAADKARAAVTEMISRATVSDALGEIFQAAQDSKLQP